MKAVARNQTFPLASPPRWLVPFLIALWVVLMVAAYLGSPHQQPASNPVPWWLVIPFATALLPIGLYVPLMHRHVAIEGDSLVLSAALVFSRKVAVHELALERARILSLEEHTEFKPMLQSGGFSLPGYKAGHYLLRNRSRAFCLLTSRQRVLLLPQRDGKYILVSPELPQALLDALRAARG